MAFLYRPNASPRGPAAERGFSLLEIVVTLAILAIGAALAMPMFRDVIRNTAVSNSTNDLVTALSSARSESIRRGVQVAVRSTSGGADWSTGWSVIADSDRSGTFTGADEVVSRYPALANQYRVYAKNAGAGGDGIVVFNMNGGVTSGGYDLNVCFPSSDSAKSRRIRVRASGNVSSHKNTAGSPATACTGI